MSFEFFFDSLCASKLFSKFSRASFEGPSQEGDYVRISKYRKRSAKGYVPSWSETVYVTKKIKNTVIRKYLIESLNGEEVIGTFYKKELQKANKKGFRMEKIIKRKGNKLYVKWKGFDDYFNSWID